MSRLGASSVVALVIGCGATEAPVPQAQGSIHLGFAHSVAGDWFELGRSHPLPDGATVRFDELRYWISNVVLLGADGASFVVPSAYYLVEHTPDGSGDGITLPNVPPGAYHTLTFAVGVDAAHNHSADDLVGQLSPSLEIEWTSDTGYKFVRAEGMYTTADGVESPFIYHVSGDEMYRVVTQTVEPPVVIGDHGAHIGVAVHIERLLEDIDVSKTPQVTTAGDPLARVLADNAADMFRVLPVVRDEPKGPKIIYVGDAAAPDASDGDDTGEPPPEIPRDTTPPVLSHSVVALTGAYDAGTQTFGDLLCSPSADRSAGAKRACITPFHLDPSANGLEDAGMFTFVTKPLAKVRSATGGTVAEVAFVEHSDITHSDLFRVSVRLGPNSPFWLEYLRVKDVSVHVGDAVYAGDVLAVAGDYFDADHGWVSFGVRRKQWEMQRLCPLDLATPDVVATWKQGLAASNQADPTLAAESLCSVPAIVCVEDKCSKPQAYAEAPADIDAGHNVYLGSCATCHGTLGEGLVGPDVCVGSGCKCVTCTQGFETLVDRILLDMPPEGICDYKCASTSAAYMLHTFVTP